MPQAHVEMLARLQQQHYTQPATPQLMALMQQHHLSEHFAQQHRQLQQQQQQAAVNNPFLQAALGTLAQRPTMPPHSLGTKQNVN